jgi:hypothetical protein
MSNLRGTLFAVALMLGAAGSNVEASSVTALTGVTCGVFGGCFVTDTNGGPTASSQQTAIDQASAMADLRDGSLHASSSGQAIARASWEEVVFFDLVGSLTSQTIGFNIAVDGTYGAVDNSGGAGLLFLMSAADAATLAISSLNARLHGSWDSSTVGVHDASELGGAPLPYGFSILSDTFINGGIYNELGPSQFSGHFTLDPGYIYAISLLMEIEGAGAFDFGNTAKFSFDSPIPFTSQSGFFLTETEVAPVPIPAALPLLLAGLAGLGILKRRGRRKTAA